MRVTSSMMTGQVVFNMQRSLQRYMDLQTNMSSGRRINKPSDDPLGTLRDLDYRTELSKIEQFQRNISQGQNWQGSYDNILADTKNLLSEAKEIAVTMSNDTYDETARQTAGNEIDSILDQIMQLSRTQLDGRRMFSGYKTKTDPFELSSFGAVYRGDDGHIDFEIESSIRQTMNFTGSETFLESYAILGEDADVNIGVSGDTLLTDLNNGNGIDIGTGTFTITDNNITGVSATIDLNTPPPATTVDELLTKINDELTAQGMNTGVTVSISDDGNSLRIDTTDTGQISASTRLTQLHSGSGVVPEMGIIRVTEGMGVPTNIDLSGAETVGDVISEFNTQMAAAGIPNVTLSVNAAGTGFQIADANVPPVDIQVTDMSRDDTTATQLGIVGSVGANLVGTDLEPQASYEIAETTGTTGADLGILGTFTSDANGEDLDPRLLATSLLSDLSNGLGLEGDAFVIWQGEKKLTVDFSDPALSTVQDVIDYINGSNLDVVAAINSDGRGLQIENADPNRSLAIVEEGDGRAAKTLGVFGSSDMIGTMLVLSESLKNDDADAVGMLLQSFDDAMTHTLEVRAEVGSRATRLETTSSRLVSLNLNFTKLLSEVEDADLTQVLTDLQTAENSYQAAMMATARIIQPSLLDFLR